VPTPSGCTTVAINYIIIPSQYSPPLLLLSNTRILYSRNCRYLFVKSRNFQWKSNLYTLYNSHICKKGYMLASNKYMFRYYILQMVLVMYVKHAECSDRRYSQSTTWNKMKIIRIIIIIYHR
jgi:hypothetical protein